MYGYIYDGFYLCGHCVSVDWGGKSCHRGLVPSMDSYKKGIDGYSFIYSPGSP